MRRFCKWALVFGMVLTTSETRAQRDQLKVKVGDQAPELGFEELLQAPPGTVANWDNLAGKVVVLEYWATWCGPCVAAFPHFNELIEKYKGQPIQFISITYEKRKLIEPFIQKKPIHAWVGLDTDKSMHRAYGVRGVPRTILVDKQGRIVGITSPKFLTEKIIDELLAGKPLSLPGMAGEKPTGEDTDDGPQPLFEVLIRPATGENQSFSRSSGQFEATGYRLPDAVAFAYQTSSTRVVVDCELPKDRIDFRVRVPADNGRLYTYLQQALEAAFGFQALRETREVEVLVLTAPDGAGPALTPTASTGGSYFSSERGRLNGVKQSAAEIGHRLEPFVKLPVVDETGLDGTFDWRISYDEQVEADLLKQFEKELGLKAARERRKIEMLVLRPAANNGD